METSLAVLVGKLNVAVGAEDWDAVTRVNSMIQEHFDEPRDHEFVAKKLFMRMDEWADIREGAIRTEDMVRVLAEEGVL